MLKHLQDLSRLGMSDNPSVAEVTRACSLIRDAVQAEEAYVIRAGDPWFIRLGCPCDPAAYEIKQAGYWFMWRFLAEHTGFMTGAFDTAERVVSGGRALAPGERCTHVAAILPDDESNSDLLIVRGPWPLGLRSEDISFLDAARPVVAYLINHVVDTGRRARLREQLELLASVSRAFNSARNSEDALTGIATAMAKASQIDWVNIVAYNDSCDRVVDRAINMARHSTTRTSALATNPRAVTTPSQLRLGVELARTNGVIRIPNVHDPGLAERPDLDLMREDIPGLQWYWKRAHVLSVAIIPIAFQQTALGYVIFSSSTPRAFDEGEVEFLKALTAQAATAIEGIRLYRDLETSRQELRQNVERFQSLVQNASDLVTVIDSDGVITYQSPSAKQVLGYDAESLLGARLFELVHPDDVPPAETFVSETLRESSSRSGLDIRMRHREGGWRYVEVIGSNQCSNPAIGGMVLNVRDVTERKLLERQLRHQARHDPLTQLVNRSRFAEMLEGAVRGAGGADRHLAVLFIDLDDFKGVNDQLGHAAGDELLMAVADRIRANVRPIDIVARLGGDEFAVLLPDIRTPDEALAVARRLIDAIDPPFCVVGREITMRASAGIAMSGPDGSGEDAAELLKDADLAMYAAKADGKGALRLFDASMKTPMLEQMELLADLRRAVDQGQLAIHYQPIYDLASRELHGIEALARWHHPRRGTISPGVFIPLAEASGVIIPLGKWIMSESCRQAAAWQSAYRGQSSWSLSVNVASRQLQRPEFVDDVASALAESGLEPSRLILEITESSLIGDVGLVRSTLRALKSLGVRIAIDDFGTGYSSLGYLREFSVDVLKIDRSFVADLGGPSGDRELVRVIVELGRTLDLEVVAEGIERIEQVDRLHAIGCKLGQGFHLAKPMEASAMAKLLAEGCGRATTETEAA